MFEIWRHVDSGERFLVVFRDGLVSVAAGPLSPDDDPRHILETHGNQNHNPLALVSMNRERGEYVREYVADIHGRITHLGNVPAPPR